MGDKTWKHSVRPMHVGGGVLRIALVPLFALISACGTQQVYPGEPRKEHELAILSEMTYFCSTTGVKRIDDLSVGTFKDRFAMLPGRHTVEGVMVAPCAGIFAGSETGPFCIEFAAVANGRYELHGDDAGDFLSWLQGKLWSMWIEDAHTGEIVAATEKLTLDEVREGLAACDVVGEPRNEISAEESGKD